MSRQSTHDKRVIAVPNRGHKQHPGDAYWIEVIERLRLEEAPNLCPTCGSVALHETRVCSGCTVMKSVKRFRQRTDGRRYAKCRDCENKTIRRHRIHRIMRDLQRAS
jgi:hypothetical protein